MKSRLTALAAAAVLVPALLVAGSASSKPEPPKPKPKLELLTESEEKALRKRAVRVGVRSRRGNRVRAEATLVVDGYPDDFVFKLGPEREPLRHREATIRFPLSARKREVLDFAIKTCRSATVKVRAEVRRGKRRGVGRLRGRLERPGECRSG